jgi:hypothetical protein
MYNVAMARKKRVKKGPDSEYQLTEYLICRVTPQFLEQLGRLAEHYSSREGITITGPLLARRILSEVVPQRLEELEAGGAEQTEPSPLPLLPPTAKDDSGSPPYVLPLLDPKR